MWVKKVVSGQWSEVRGQRLVKERRLVEGFWRGLGAERLNYETRLKAELRTWRRDQEQGFTSSLGADLRKADSGEFAGGQAKEDVFKAFALF
jgi:hypothetical protein